MWRILLEVLCSRVIVWKPSEQANMLISFWLTSTRFCLFRAPWMHQKLHDGRFTGIYFELDRCRLFSQQWTVSEAARLWLNFAVCICAFCEHLCTHMRCFPIRVYMLRLCSTAPRVLHFCASLNVRSMSSLCIVSLVTWVFCTISSKKSWHARRENLLCPWWII